MISWQEFWNFSSSSCGNPLCTVPSKSGQNAESRRRNHYMWDANLPLCPWLDRRRRLITKFKRISHEEKWPQREWDNFIRKVVERQAQGYIHARAGTILIIQQSNNELGWARVGKKYVLGCENRADFDQLSQCTGSCEKIPACLNFPALFLPTDLGSQCTAHQPWRNMCHRT